MEINAPFISNSTTKALYSAMIRVLETFGAWFLVRPYQFISTISYIYRSTIYIGSFYLLRQELSFYFRPDSNLISFSQHVSLSTLRIILHFGTLLLKYQSNIK